MSTYLNSDNSVSVGHVPEKGTQSVFNITANTLVKVGAGRAFVITVVVAGSGAGSVHDIDTIGAAAAANQFYATPVAVGSFDASWPLLKGLVVKPGTGQTIAISYA